MSIRVWLTRRCGRIRGMGLEWRPSCRRWFLLEAQVTWARTGSWTGTIGCPPPTRSCAWRPTTPTSGASRPRPRSSDAARTWRGTTYFPSLTCLIFRVSPRTNRTRRNSRSAIPPRACDWSANGAAKSMPGRRNEPFRSCARRRPFTRSRRAPASALPDSGTWKRPSGRRPVRAAIRAGASTFGTC